MNSPDTSGPVVAQDRAGRRTLHWDRVKTVRARFAIFIATGFGSGLAPMAPGTFGTLAAVPIVYLLTDVSLIGKSAFWIVLLILGIWSAKVFDETMQTQDNQNIVIDEVLGYAITAWTAGGHALTLAAAVALFRFFDILKPPPIKQIDHWSRSLGHSSPWAHGFGVIADDLVAGIEALFVVLVLQHFGVLP